MMVDAYCSLYVDPLPDPLAVGDTARKPVPQHLYAPVTDPELLLKYAYLIPALPTSELRRLQGELGRNVKHICIPSASAAATPRFENFTVNVRPRLVLFS